MTKTYGRIVLNRDNDTIELHDVAPHVSIKLKDVFRKIPAYATCPYVLKNSPENASDVLWFIDRYPFKITPESRKHLERGKRVFNYHRNEIERVMMAKYEPAPMEIKAPHKPRKYQLQANEIFSMVERMLLGDQVGLGKTLTSILAILDPKNRPAAVVVQSHLTNQWKTDQIEKYSDLKVHIIKTKAIYDLPQADVYIFKYSFLIGWVNIFEQRLFKSVYFDEIQELRRTESKKHQAGRVLSAHVNKAMGLSATPIYNFGDEIFNIMDLLKPGVLGRRDDFLREWAIPYGDHWKIKDPPALGTYLREQGLMLRRTRQEVGRELPPINKIIHEVETDEEELNKAEDLARQLALKVISGDFTQRGQAARELDMLARHTTGMAKARPVANYVKFLLESGEKVVLAGWHRDVYDIWLAELKDFKPVMYTGSEVGKKKEESLRKFIEHETNIMIISLRSGAGIDGLQSVCDLVVHGELDWSPQVHEQLNGRFRRDGAKGQLTAIYPVIDSGSDPLIMDYLGLKASQAHGIIDPLLLPGEQNSDAGRIKMLANYYLNKTKNG
jgi:SNF2 family DNA or RNA helicase